MGDVTRFPGGMRPPPTGDVWDVRTRLLDERYALEVLQKRLPAAAQRHVTWRDLEAIASAILVEVDRARHQRRFDLRYDERRAGGEMMALEEMMSGAPRTSEPEPPASA